MSDKLVEAVEAFFASVRSVRLIGSGTNERSFYPALAGLLDGVGRQLRPRVTCLSDLANVGAGHPDFGLFAAGQLQKGMPRPGRKPERGVVEMKGLQDDVASTAASPQVARYFAAYRLVLVTNLRDFQIVGVGSGGDMALLERFTLADSADGFWRLADDAKASAKRLGPAFGEFLVRALTQTVSLREPKDVASFLASYARDALQRVEKAGPLAALGDIRTSLETALGVTFEGGKGDRFFRSTLVQTLFYGIFAAWILWSRDPHRSATFDWRAAMWHLRVPFVRTLFQQVVSPRHLEPLGLVEVMDWAAAALNRVDADQFASRFKGADAVLYFYEPFLEAFDPVLRRELGVWYTPTEVVDYMVDRVDLVLREDLGIKEGLASDRVVVLDPCCGTGAYVASVLRKIHAALPDHLGALKGIRVVEAAMRRIFGFELMPAPFVVAHLQIGLALQAMGAALGADQRPGIYLTNALTGWEGESDKPLPFPELEEERAAAEEVKRQEPILVVIGNPPYNGFAGMAVAEERELSDAYRTSKVVRRPEGQGLNDLYVRFFRMAERRIAEKTGQGIVCFVSNNSWLDGTSFTGMRERYLDAFDAIRIDCLNGDKYKTNKTTPTGLPDPSVFSTEHNREGIQVGTAIATLVRKTEHTPSTKVEVRQLWGTGKRAELARSSLASPQKIYVKAVPVLQLGLPFVGRTVSPGYLEWPSLPQLLPRSFSGVKTARDEFLVSMDRGELERRIRDYFDKKSRMLN